MTSYHVDFFETEVYDYHRSALQEHCEDIVHSLLKELNISKSSSPKIEVRFPDPVKLLTTKRKYVRKTFPVTPNCIIFNKSIMAKHPHIELNTTSVFKSRYDMRKVLDSEEACREHLEKLRWNGEPICPSCGSQRENHYRMKTRGVYKGQYKCRDCRSTFSVTVGTIFEKSQIPLTKWFEAVFLFNSGKKGISSLQLQREIGVTQKTAWFMLSRLRNAVTNRIDFEFEGIVQVDETFVGGKNQNRTKAKRVANTQGRSLKTKVPVFGMLNDGLVYAEVVKDTRGKTLKTIIRDKVKEGSVVVSDGWQGYRGLHRDYVHQVIPHNRNIFKKDGYHTNGIEGFWSLLKRGLVGMYHSVSHKHLHLYCDEFAYRYNTRKLKVGEQFNLLLINSDERLTYKELITE
jgi:transposase-like protein